MYFILLPRTGTHLRNVCFNFNAGRLQQVMYLIEVDDIHRYATEGRSPHYELDIATIVSTAPVQMAQDLSHTTYNIIHSWIIIDTRSFRNAAVPGYIQREFCRVEKRLGRPPEEVTCMTLPK